MSFTGEKSWNSQNFLQNKLQLWLQAKETNAESCLIITKQYGIDSILNYDSNNLEFDFPSEKKMAISANLDKKYIVNTENKKIGIVVDINTSASEQKEAISYIGSVEWILLQCIGTWKMIPVENLISMCENSGTKLAVFVDDPQSLPGIVNALHIGPRAILLPPNPALWKLATSLYSERITAEFLPESSCSTNHKSVNHIKLDEAEVTDVQASGLGDRICIDLIQTLEVGEGLLVGSTAKSLVLVHAETTSSELVPARPFRVNAGPVHSYVLLQDGTMKYLSEVIPGDTVKVVDAADGSSRGVVVGRCKIEPRPVVMISYQYVNELDEESHNNNLKVFHTGQLFLQQAETVRLVRPRASNDNSSSSSSSNSCIKNDCRKSDDMSNAGSIVENELSHSPMSLQLLSVTDIQRGDKILIYKNEEGTHLGKRIRAKVIEK